MSRLNSASNGASSVLSGNDETRGNENVDEDELLNLQTCPSQILSNCEILNWDVNVPQRSTVCGNAYQKVLTDDNKEKYYKCKLTPPFGSCKIDKTSEGLCKKPADPVTPEGQEGGGSEIQTEQFGPYTFYKGVLGFEGQGGLECNQTLNANPQETANWCNTNSECNGYYTYSKDGTGSEPNAKRVCFKKNIDPTKTPTMTTS